MTPCKRHHGDHRTKERRGWPLAGLVAFAWLLAAPVDAVAADRFSFDASVGGEYDSNVSVPELDVTSREGDYSALIDGAVRYRQPLGNTSSVDLGYSFSQKFYDEFTQFDRQMHGLGSGFQSRAGDISFGARYDFYYMRLGGAKFLTMHRASPFISFRLSKAVTLRVNYAYADTDLKNRVDRDYAAHNIGADVHYFLNERRSRLSLGYRLQLRDATADQFDFDGHRIRARFRTKLPIGSPNWVLRLGGHYEMRDYKAVTPSIGAIRDDDRLQATVDLKIPFGRTWYMAVEYDFRDASSNLPSADYTENVVALKFGVEL